MTDIWFLSGLGADERLFQNLDFTGWKVHYVKWSKPSPCDTVGDYAQRLLAQITEKEPVLIGCSFGGMLAIEMAKIISVKKVILISSSKTRMEMPPYFRWASHFPFLFKLLPLHLIAKARWLHYRRFRARDIKDKKLLSDFLQNMDYSFVHWSMKAITKWGNETIPKNVVHIHGTADRVLPYKYVRADISVKEGSHLMVFNRATEISKYLHAIVDNL